MEGPAAADAPLDAPIRASLARAHAHLAEVRGRARRYPPEVAPFGALEAEDPAAWADLAALVGPRGRAALSGPSAVPAGWEVEATFPVVQLVEGAAPPAPASDGAAEVVELAPADVPAMRELVARTRPGPFGPRTIELGRYLGVRRDGHLVAMAGERMRPPGWTEVSAVCTAPEVRGQGLAVLLIEELARGIRARGERSFLHVLQTNAAALALYDRLGYVERRRTRIVDVRAPAA